MRRGKFRLILPKGETVMDLTERKLKILQAIIGDFIGNAEPVGSRTLSKKYNLGISSATIRNEMADLEELGFLTHPHTSAGRVPSEKAYRLYVDEIMKKKELSKKKKDIISKKLYDNVRELGRTIQHASEILSEITNLTSFAITPITDENKLKFIQLLPMDDHTVVLMIAAESGQVSNTALRVKVPYSDESLELLSKSMTVNYAGRTISEALTLDIIHSFETDIEAMSNLARDIMPDFMRTLEDMLDVHLYMEGLMNIFSIPEYSDMEKAKRFMEMLNKKDNFARVLKNRDNGVMITIGTENTDDIMEDCSLITAAYHVDGKFVGKLGVIGPTRMNYEEVTSVIEYLTENISDAFRITEGDNDD